ncbi:hypothetical protein ACWGDX_12945 [Streptomyces sp. NPDC055025]
MMTTLQSYGLTWTDLDGISRAAAVSYDKASAEHRRQQLEAAGCTRVRVAAVKPGEHLSPEA